jgi:hypothetical protein
MLNSLIVPLAWLLIGSLVLIVTLMLWPSEEEAEPPDTTAIFGPDEPSQPPP